MRKKNRVPVLMDDRDLAMLDALGTQYEVSRGESIRLAIRRNYRAIFGDVSPTEILEEVKVPFDK